MINLAPNTKTGLLIDSPLIAGSGAAGYGDAWPPGLKPEDFGLLITAPVSADPRKGKAQPRLAEIPAGFLLETGDHNPGFRRLLASHAQVWRRMKTPVVLSLVGGEPGDRAWMAAHLEELEEVIGVCNRVIVMREGRIAGDINGGEINEEEIMQLATGVKQGVAA